MFSVGRSIIIERVRGINPTDDGWMAETARIGLLVSRPIVANAPQADPLSLVIMRPAGATMRVLLRIVAGFSLVSVLFTVLLLVRVWQGGGVAWVLSANTVVQTSIISWIITVCLGPIAVSQLWRLRPLGRISGAVLWGNIALYQLWLLWFRTQRTLFPLELLLFGFCTMFLVVLLSPSARRVCSSCDSATRSAVASEEIRQPTEFDGYAGFWRRFAAGLIDVVVAALIAVLLGAVSGSAFAFMSGLVIVSLRWGNITEEGLADLGARGGGHRHRCVHRLLRRDGELRITGDPGEDGTWRQGHGPVRPADLFRPGSWTNRQ